MIVRFKMLSALAAAIRADLLRPHPFAAERVGFISCRVGRTQGGLVILASDYRPVEDSDYEDDPSVGAMMGSAAIRKALQRAHTETVSMFHVHMHDHSGRAGFSRVDSRESAKFIPDFFNVRPKLPHGALVLSQDSGFGMCWPSRGTPPVAIREFVFVSWPMQKVVLL